jgi:secreted Zn-dependent insulinase-like peptidase
MDKEDRYPNMGTFAALENAPLVYYRNVYNPNNLNSSIEYLIQVGPEFDQYSRSNLLILCQLAREPAFDQLRTKEQLGYVVYSGQRSQQMLGFRYLKNIVLILVLSYNLKSPLFILRRELNYS